MPDSDSKADCAIFLCIPREDGSVPAMFVVISISDGEVSVGEDWCSEVWNIWRNPGNPNFDVRLWRSKVMSAVRVKQIGRIRHTREVNEPDGVLDGRVRSDESRDRSLVDVVGFVDFRWRDSPPGVKLKAGKLGYSQQHYAWLLPQHIPFIILLRRSRLNCVTFSGISERMIVD